MANQSYRASSSDDFYPNEDPKIPSSASKPAMQGLEHILHSRGVKKPSQRPPSQIQPPGDRDPRDRLYNRPVSNHGQPSRDNSPPTYRGPPRDYRPPENKEPHPRESVPLITNRDDEPSRHPRDYEPPSYDRDNGPPRYDGDPSRYDRKPGDERSRDHWGSRQPSEHRSNEPNKPTRSGSCTFTELKQDADKENMENGGLSLSTETVSSESQQNISFMQQKRTSKRILIGVIVAILIIACIVLLVLLILQIKKGEKTPSKPAGSYCYTSQCLNVASIQIRDMDKNINPCDDFMKYSCDGWVRTHKIDEGQDEQAGMFLLGDLNDQKLRFHIENLGRFNKSHPLFKVKNYYASCVNEYSIEQNSVQDFQKFLNWTGPWPVLDSSWDGSSWNWTVELARFQSNFFDQAPLITLEVMVNPKNTKEYVFHVIPPELLLKDELTSNNTKVKAALLEYMVRIVVLLGGNEKTAKAQMEDVLKFSIEVAKINPPTGIVYNHWYDTYDISHLEAQTGFPWKTYFSLVLKDYNLTLDVNRKVAVPYVKYLKDLAQLLDKTDGRTVLNYLMWKVVSSQVPYLSSKFLKARSDYKQKVFGVTGTIARWLRCIKRLNSVEGLTMAMGKIWIDNEFDKDIVPFLKEMMEAIKQAFKDEVNGLTWLDEESKKKAFEKVDVMKDKMGFPALCNNLTMLTEYYRELEINSVDHYLLNVMNMSDWYRNFEISKMERRVNPTEWLVGPQIVNAFYKMSHNEIIINAGILQPPFYYGKEAPRAVNFGAIGTVLGHELTHGFDYQGSRFNKFGELGKPWMSNSSLTEFEKRSQCMASQYSNYYSDLGNGKKIKNDGIQTLSENIADNAGLRLTYRAYKNWVAKHGEEKEMPGLGLNNDQILFLSFGQLYCYKAKPSGIKRRIMTDSHALPEFRTIGSTSNFEEFSASFKCPANAKMNPSKKCRVW